MHEILNREVVVERDRFFMIMPNQVGSRKGNHFATNRLTGFYNPEKSAGQGGVQLGNDDTNIYAWIIVAVLF